MLVICIELCIVVSVSTIQFKFELLSSFNFTWTSALEVSIMHAVNCIVCLTSGTLGIPQNYCDLILD